MTTMTEAAYKREQAEKKKDAAAAKKKAAPKSKKKKALGSCAKVREIADRNPKAKPAEVYAKCEAAGVHPRTTRAEYSNWCVAKYGKTPSKQFGTSSKSGKSTKKKATGGKGKTTARLRAA